VVGRRAGELASGRAAQADGRAADTLQPAEPAEGEGESKADTDEEGDEEEAEGEEVEDEPEDADNQEQEKGPWKCGSCGKAPRLAHGAPWADAQGLACTPFLMHPHGLAFLGAVAAASPPPIICPRHFFAWRPLALAPLPAPSARCRSGGLPRLPPTSLSPRSPSTWLSELSALSWDLSVCRSSLSLLGLGRALVRAFSPPACYLA
jgi:hypothetical protein